MKGIRLLQCWKQRQGSMATYKALVEALLQISRTDFAEKVVALSQSLQRDGVQSSLSLNKSGDLTAPTSPASSSGVEDASSSIAMSPLPSPATPNEHEAQEVILTIKELEEEFYDLVIHIEDTLENSKVSLDTITRRFRMLPQSVRRQHETDENYIATRQKILDSKTIKKLFDNLTELKHWNYMTPDTLAHVVKDVKIDDVHRKINEYKDKLATFKANTKLRELIGISFPVPDYCMELTMKIEGWENKTIKEAENSTINVMRQAVYRDQNIRLGWKGVNTGCIMMMFILVESAVLNKDVLAEGWNDTGIISVQLDEDNVFSVDQIEVYILFTSTPYM